VALHAAIVVRSAADVIGAMIAATLSAITSARSRASDFLVVLIDLLFFLSSSLFK